MSEISDGESLPFGIPQFDLFELIDVMDVRRAIAMIESSNVLGDDSVELDFILHCYNRLNWDLDLIRDYLFRVLYYGDIRRSFLEEGDIPLASSKLVEFAQSIFFDLTFDPRAAEAFERALRTLLSGDWRYLVNSDEPKKLRLLFMSGSGQYFYYALSVCSQPESVESIDLLKELYLLAFNLHKYSDRNFIDVKLKWV